jgi:hypothetical protein
MRSFPPVLESKRIADPNEVIHGRAGQACSNVEIKLLERAQLVRCADMQQVPRPAAFRKVARVFHKYVLKAP